MDYYCYLTIDIETNKVLILRGMDFSIIFMDDEIYMNNEWFSYKDIEELSFQISTIHTGLEFILDVRHDV